MIDDVVSALLAHPRSFLLAHIAPLLPRHPEAASHVQASANDSQASWTADYPGVLQAFGIQLRPDWPAERLTLAIQIILDGTLVRCRVEPDHIAAARWRNGSIYADTVLAVVASAIDTNNDRRTTSQWLDDQIANLNARTSTSTGRIPYDNHPTAVTPVQTRQAEFGFVADTDRWQL